MREQSRTDWSSFDAANIPSKEQIPELDAWLDALQARGAQRVLDVGCGAGVVTRRILARGLDVVGVDIHAGVIAQLQREHAGDERASFIRGDVASLKGLPSQHTFDGAVCQLVASIVGDAQDRVQLLQNIARVLGPAGALFISFSGLSDDLNAEYARLYASDQAVTGEFGSYESRDARGRVLYRTHHYSRREITTLLERTGFGDLHIHEHVEASSRRPDQRARFYYVTCQRI